MKTKMNWNKIDRLAMWAVWVSLGLVIAVQQHALWRSRSNERAAGDQVVKLSLENSALRQRLDAK